MSFSTLRPLCCAIHNSVCSRARACSTLGMPSFRITVLTLAAMFGLPSAALRGTPYHLSPLQPSFAAVYVGLKQALFSAPSRETKGKSGSVPSHYGNLGGHCGATALRQCDYWLRHCK